MLLASILITSSDSANSALPEVVRENIDSFKRHHPGLQHVLYDDNTIRDLLSANFDRGVSAAYERLNPYAYKADLARYCILYHHGGVYSDISYYFVRSWLPRNGKLAIFRDFLSSSPWDTSNGVIAAPPGHKALQKAIDLVCANVRARYYGATSLCPTGPTMFGKALALTCDPEELIAGQAAWVSASLPARLRRGLSGAVRKLGTRSRDGEGKLPREFAAGSSPTSRDLLPSTGEHLERGDWHCLFAEVSSRELVAMKRKRGGGTLRELGIPTGNSYKQMWNDRRVYGA